MAIISVKRDNKGRSESEMSKKENILELRYIKCSMDVFIDTFFKCPIVIAIITIWLVTQNGLDSFLSRMNSENKSSSK